jgi:outer membrane protein TolC
MAWGESLEASRPDTEPAQQDASPKDSLTPMTLRDKDTFHIKAVLTKTEEYPIDLATVLRLIYDQNLLVAQNKVDIDIRKNLLYQKAAEFLPNVDGSLSQSRLDGGTQVFGGEVFRVVRNTVQPQVTASLTLHPGGKTIYETLAAKRRTEMAEIQLKETYQNQLARAAEDYYKLLAAQFKKEGLLQGLKEIMEQVQLNQARFDVGKGTYLEVIQAKTSLAQQKRLLQEVGSEIILAEQALLNRLNLDPEIHLMSTETETAMKRLVKDQPLGELIAVALNQHPSIQRLDDELKALGFDYKGIRSSLLPSVTLRTYLNATGPEWDNLTRTQFSGFTINMNLLENLGAQIPLRLHAKKKEIERKILEQKSLIRDIETQVTAAYLNSQNFSQAVAAAEEELAYAEEGYKLATGRFKTGFGINLDVLNAETALMLARTNLAQVILDYNQAQVRLVEALGIVSPDSLLNGVSTDEEGS